MKNNLEKFLTGIPTHKLTIGGLIILNISALILSFIGKLPFEPFELLITTILFVSTGVTTSYALGKLYGASSHLLSAVITSLILALLFTPSLESLTLLQYALISIIAQASKYIVAYKRRHIFNPVAFGALMGGLLNLHFASWWVASPPMIISAIITAFVVLYKTRLLQLGIFFVVFSIVLITASGVLRNEELLTTITTSLASWPIIFLAGFMLSEPLTLPARRWQKFIVGALIAIVVSLPFSIGWFHSSPEFAILVGNLLAFCLAFNSRSGLQLTLKARHKLTPVAYEYVFESPKIINFQPGQFIELTIPHKNPDIRGIRRSFSITSPPGQKELRLGIRFYESGSSYKQQLRSLDIGSEVQSTGISGDFLLPKDTKQKLLFVAGGIGITPFISHILSGQVAKRDITLLYFVHSSNEIAYKSTLDKSSLKVHYFVLNTKVKQSTPDYISAEILEKYVPDIKSRKVYISGSPTMVTSAKKSLKAKTAGIHTDYFSGY